MNEAIELRWAFGKKSFGHFHPAALEFSLAFFHYRYPLAILLPPMSSTPLLPHPIREKGQIVNATEQMAQVGQLSAHRANHDVIQRPQNGQLIAKQLHLFP